MTWRAALAGLALGACHAREDAAVMVPTLAAACARAGDALVVVHFRLPGRPLSDAMDTALTSARVQALAPQAVHTRIDAAAEPDLFARLCGGSTRRGGGLATCVCDAAGQALACRVGYMHADELPALLTAANTLRDELRAHGGAGSPASTLALAAHFAGLGRTDLARERYATVAAVGAAAEQAQAASALARLAVEDGNLDACRNWLARATNADARDDLTRAMLSLAARQPQLALSALQTLAQQPTAAEHALVLLHLGRAQHETGDDKAALATFDLLCATWATSPPAQIASQLAAHVRSGDPGHRHDTTFP